MVNPYKADLTPVQLQVVERARSKLLLQLQKPPFSQGQRDGEFSVSFDKEYIDNSGTLDRFIIEHADQQLDECWTTDLPPGSDLMHEGRGTYRLFVPHAAYYDTEKRARWNLPFRLTGTCIWHTTRDLVGAIAFIWAAYAIMPESDAGKT